MNRLHTGNVLLSLIVIISDKIHYVFFLKQFFMILHFSNRLHIIGLSIIDWCFLSDSSTTSLFYRLVNGHVRKFSFRPWNIGTNVTICRKCDLSMLSIFCLNLLENHVADWPKPCEWVDGTICEPNFSTRSTSYCIRGCVPTDLCQIVDHAR